ncbi:MAG: GNAT family N-acetyltransferase, partial [Candidatus Eisenbacteria bacterium]|nr:GNAT family N-acetyltransferase [Candidatus Eisenbacteria bacterium]
PFWSHGNPVDVLGDARPKRVARATEIVLADPGVDAALVILTPQAMTNPSSTARAIGELAANASKPILCAWLGGKSMREGIAILNQAGIATYTTPEQAVRAFMTLVAYARNLDILFETPRDISITFPRERWDLRRSFRELVEKDGEILSEESSKRLLEAYAIPTTRPIPAATEEQAVAAAEAIRYPVVLKVLSPDITHKTDVGGVVLDLDGPADVRAAFARIVASVRRRAPQARIDGVTVQRMIRTKDSFEMILGMKRDPTFGSVILVGAGGVTAEVLRDRALGFPPLNERLARRMLESLGSWPLLQGYRGRPGVDVDSLITILMRFSYLVADYPEIRELDINPLLVSPDEAVALDARVVVDSGRVGEGPGSYEHLALRPYPEEYVTEKTLKDGARVLLRPIRPEDEPMWKDLLSRCSAETIYARFRSAFQWRPHEIATRYCFIDYDREIALVAETDEGDQRRLAGVGRLIADPMHETVEYAVLVADAWQNRGLGGVLTDACFEIAKHWGLKRIVAETAPDNTRMISLFRNRGFHLVHDVEGEVVEVFKELPGSR